MNPTQALRPGVSIGEDIVLTLALLSLFLLFAMLSNDFERGLFIPYLLKQPSHLSIYFISHEEEGGRSKYRCYQTSSAMVAALI
jgi:hypothetical protein